MSDLLTVFGNCQSIGVSPNLTNAALQRENGLEPKNPRSAENGLG